MKDCIVECNVWCVANSQDQIDMGLPAGDSWMPFAIDFRVISSIKLSGENDFLGNDKATIYYSGREVTLDVPYKEAIIKWREALLSEMK
jgi:hypothetical protein